MTTPSHPFDRLQQTVKQLRGPDGCPWDRKQTVHSLVKYLREEFAEIITAIDTADANNLCEELGDFLYLILMIAEISSEQDYFTISDVIGSIDRKLIRRHPHVFETHSQIDEAELRKQWERIKKSEKTGE
jgi:tetrapyrrole methylase family protein/MazG family protein